MQSTPQGSHRTGQVFWTRGFTGYGESERHNNWSLVSKSLKYQLNPLGLADFSSSYSDGISAHRLCLPPFLRLGWAWQELWACLCQTLDLRVSVFPL